MRKRAIIVIGSVTYTMKAKELLDKFSIKSYIEKTSNCRKTKGCSYGLYVPRYSDKAFDILTNNKFNIKEIIYRDDK